MSAPAELLRKVPLLVGLPDSELSAVAALARRRRYERGDQVVQQGDVGGDLFVIAAGYLKVARTDSEGRGSTLNIMGPPEVFGEVSLLDGEPRSATITSLTRSELLVVGREPFLRFLESSPKAAIELLRALAGRLRRLTTRADDVAFLSVDQRLARCVARLIAQYGERQPDGSVRLPFKLSQTELGELVDATRESVNKRFVSWKRAELIEERSGHWVVREVRDLQRALNEHS